MLGTFDIDVDGLDRILRISQRMGVRSQGNDIVYVRNIGQRLTGIVLHKVEVAVAEIFPQTCGGFLATTSQSIDGDVSPVVVIAHQRIDETAAQQSRCSSQQEAFTTQPTDARRLQNLLQVVLIQPMLLVETYFSHVSLSIFR